jgi:hypothetical protein
VLTVLSLDVIEADDRELSSVVEVDVADGELAQMARGWRCVVPCDPIGSCGSSGARAPTPTVGTSTRTCISRNRGSRPHQLDLFLATPALRLTACWADLTQVGQPTASIAQPASTSEAPNQQR